MVFYLIRHGKSISNEKKLVTGTEFDQLSQEGINQVIELKKLLNKANIKADYYYVSQWNRAKETANLIDSTVDWFEDKSIGETNAGDVREFLLEDFINQYPKFYLDNSNHYPNGESHLDLNKRVINWFNEIVYKLEENDRVMIVAHSGPISCILQYITSIDMDKFPFFLVDNASLTVIEIDNKLILNAKIKQLSSLSDKNFISKYGLKDD